MSNSASAQICSLVKLTWMCYLRSQTWLSFEPTAMYTKALQCFLFGMHSVESLEIDTEHPGNPLGHL